MEQSMSKGSLTFEEKITAAYLHYVQGIDQHVIATAMLVNQGRINEACVAIRRALKKPPTEVIPIERADNG
jgi:hypothetical protein